MRGVLVHQHQPAIGRDGDDIGVLHLAQRRAQRIVRARRVGSRRGSGIGCRGRARDRRHDDRQLRLGHAGQGHAPARRGRAERQRERRACGRHRHSRARRPARGLRRPPPARAPRRDRGSAARPCSDARSRPPPRQAGRARAQPPGAARPRSPGGRRPGPRRVQQRVDTGRPLTVNAWCAAVARVSAGEPAKPGEAEASRVASTGTSTAAASARAGRQRAPRGPAPADRTASRPSMSSRIATPGAASASRRSDGLRVLGLAARMRRNLRRAGVAKNRSRDHDPVPGGPAAGMTARDPAGLHLDGVGLRRAGRAGGDAETRRRADRGQRLAAKAERGDTLQIVPGELGGGVALHRERRGPPRVMPAPSSVTSIRSMPPAARAPRRCGRAPASSAFSTSSFTRGGRPLDHLAGGDAVDHRLGEQPNAAHRPVCGTPPPTPSRKGRGLRGARLLPLPLREGVGGRGRSLGEVRGPHQPSPRSARNRPITALVEASSGIAGAGSPLSAGRMELASCLPNSTPHWSKLSMFHRQPCTATLCS